MQQSDVYGEQRLGPLFDQPVDGPFARSKFRPTGHETLIASLIWQHRGRARPISITRLQELTGLSERTIKGVVEELVVSHRMRIGARREDPSGYFIIEDAADLEAAVKPYKAQVIAMLRRLRALESAEAVREFLGQLALELEG